MPNGSRRCCLVAIEEDTQEIQELCRTLGIDIVRRIIQKRDLPDPHTFIGAGKLEELKEYRDEIDLFVFDGNLEPSQHFRLETALKKPCVDRIIMVLEIFENNAGSTEAKYQVSLARIRYELPIVREWVNKALSDDRPGFLAGGEYAIDAYYENARKQMKKIELDLRKISSERKERRIRRKDMGFFLVSICGYTNVGKSSLLNCLSSSSILVEDKMFSTLSTTTRKVADIHRKVLLTDTVGFIRNLPPNLLDAFDATLEEIFESDCVILMLDISDDIPKIKEKLSASLKILVPKIPIYKIIIAFNKIDEVSDEEIQYRLNQLEEELRDFSWYLISVKKNLGLNELTEGILFIAGRTKQYILTLPNDEFGKEIFNWVADRHSISTAQWNDSIVIHLKLTEEGEERIMQRLSKTAGSSLSPDISVSSGN